MRSCKWVETERRENEHPGGYIKTAKAGKFSGFFSDRNFFVSISQEFSCFHGVFFIFSVLTLLPGLSETLMLGRPECQPSVLTTTQCHIGGLAKALNM